MHHTAENIPDALYEFAKDLYPIPRSLTGDGVRKTLGLIQKKIPGLKVFEVPTGTECFDWTVPNEWNVRDAYIICPDGKKICDFKKNNLHLVGYSEPIQQSFGLEELKEHLHSLPDMPTAIPYVTSYYAKSWGFCISENEKKSLKPGQYQVVIDSTLDPGNLTYGELILPGKSEKEVLLSTYVCHPSMGNNEVSGPVVLTFLSMWLSTLQERRYTYRIYFGPETIGAIYYISKNLEQLKTKTLAGFVLTCVGDDRSYSYMPSRDGDTFTDRLALKTYEKLNLKYKKYSFLDRGSDERQYCSPGVDLPVVSMMRSKYHTYPEYHTSLDDINLISTKGLAGSYQIHQEAIAAIESEPIYKSTFLCEARLGKRGLMSNLSTKMSYISSREFLDFLAYADGITETSEILKRSNIPFSSSVELIDLLKSNGLITEI